MKISLFAQGRDFFISLSRLCPSRNWERRLLG